MLTDRVTQTSATPRKSRLRWLRWVLVAVLVLLVVVYAGGGWYFSGRIHSDGLEVKPYPVERNLTLTPQGDGAIAIRSTDAKERAMLDAPSTYGLKWKGGYGQVSGPVRSKGQAGVVRRFEVLTGTAPARGTRAEIDLVAFPDDPTFALGASVRTIDYTSPLGRFPAWFVPGSAGAPGSAGGPPGVQKTWAILVHGKGGSRMEMFRMTRATAAAGLPSLDITYRNDPHRPRDPSDYYQYGRTEWRDLAGAVAYAADHGATAVVLGADSMGGGIVASYLRHHRTKDIPVTGVVLDAPMLDFRRTVEFGAEQLDLPLVGGVPGSLTAVAARLAAFRYDLDWDSIDYLDDVSWLAEPALVFHGTADTTVPIATSRQLAREKKDLVTLVETKGVEHVRSWNADPDAYDAAIRRLRRRALRAGGTSYDLVVPAATSDDVPRNVIRPSRRDDHVG